MNNIELAILRLFKGIELPGSYTPPKTTNNLYEKTIEYGFLFAPHVLAFYPTAALVKMIPTIHREVGITALEMNSSFHKSWGIVKDSPIEVLYLQQIVHYITTYGFEAMDIYDESTVYIPAEKLEISNVDSGKVKLTIIRGYSQFEIKEKLLELLGSGIALKKQTVEDCQIIAEYLKLTIDEVNAIKNKEVRIALYDEFNMVPKDATEFVRFMIYKLTDSTLLIKNIATVNAIKESNSKARLELLTRYQTAYGLQNLATVFFRFKPLFLAMRGTSKLNHIINIIRRLATQYHKPMPVDYLNDITRMIKHGEVIDEAKLNSELSKVNVFRKARLAYALKFRLSGPESILYRIRNGKSFATDFDVTIGQKNAIKRTLHIVNKSIVTNFKPNVENKKIYIPKDIRYTVPATEKQFTGNFPAGTSIEVSNDMIFGIHWTNQNNYSVDLDMALINADIKIGWDKHYRTHDILFSGDITDAPLPNGASELFYIKNARDTALLMTINYYNYDPTVTVPYTIVVGQKTSNQNWKTNYMIDPNSFLAVAKSEINERQKIAGLIVSTENGARFYFAESAFGNTISSRRHDYIDQAKTFLFDYYENALTLDECLTDAGAILVDNVEEADIDLSPEALSKDTIISLMI